MIPKLQAADDAGISYRQINHWQRQGYVRVTYFDAAGEEVPARGPMNGFHAYPNAVEHLVLLSMARLVRAGVRPETAAVWARLIVEASAPEIDLGHGIRIVIDQAAS